MFGVMEVAVTDTNSSNKGRQANYRICNENRCDGMEGLTDFYMSAGSVNPTDLIAAP